MGESQSKPQELPQPKPNPELEKPWRKFDWGQREALKEKLENFSPSHPDVKDIKILVAGQVGAGKSSFINSINSAFQGRISSRALVNSSGGNSHSFTQNLKGYTIRSGRKSLPFVIKDIMGLEPDQLVKSAEVKPDDMINPVFGHVKDGYKVIKQGAQTDDIINAVFGHVKDGYKFNEKQTLTDEDQHYTCDPDLSDQAFCLVYVIPADTVQFTDDKLNDKLKIIRQAISAKGIPQVIVMTKVDDACPLVNKDLRKVYTSKKIKEKMHLCSDKLGLPLSNIFPVKNYHDEIETEDDVDVLILKALDQIVQLADDKLVDVQSD